MHWYTYDAPVTSRPKRYMGPWVWGIFTSTLIASWETNAGLYTRAAGTPLPPPLPPPYCRRRTAAAVLPPPYCRRRTAVALLPPPYYRCRRRDSNRTLLKAEMNDSSFKGNPFSAQATQCKPKAAGSTPLTVC